MANVESALAALSDPTRRAVFERVAKRPAAVGEIARGLPVSRPAVSQHLKVLKAARLVTDEASGTSRIYRLDPAGLMPVRRWLGQVWDEALAAFAEAAAKEAGAAADDREDKGDAP